MFDSEPDPSPNTVADTVASPETDSEPDLDSEPDNDANTVT